MSLTKDGFYKSFSGAIGNNNYLLEAGGGHKQWSESASNSTIVARTANGYVYANWFNTTSGDMGSTSFSRIYVSNDSFIRYVTKAEFIGDLGAYWANIKVKSASDTATTPQFGYVGIGAAVNSSYRLYVGGTGYFTGQLHAKVAQGTSPLAVTSTTLVSNLNVDLLDNLHANSDTDKLYYTSKNVTMSTVLTVWYIKIELSGYAQPPQIFIQGSYNNQVDRAIFEFSGMSHGYIYRNINQNSGNITGISNIVSYHSSEHKWIMWLRLREIDNRSSHYSPSSSATYTIYLGYNNSSFNVTATTTAPTDVTWTSTTGGNEKIILKGATIYGALSGNASTATKLATARTINGTSFDGSANITTSFWGTARTITIGNTGKSVNGTANVSWTLAEIGAASSGHNHDSVYVKKAGDTMTGQLVFATGQNKGFKFANGTTFDIAGTSDGGPVMRGGYFRFTNGTDWDYSSWAGLGYNTSAKTIYLGIPGDGTIFQKNSRVDTGGKLQLVNISSITLDGSNGNTYKVWHQNNDGSGSGLDADLLDGYHYSGTSRGFINIGYNRNGPYWMLIASRNYAADTWTAAKMVFTIASNAYSGRTVTYGIVEVAYSHQNATAGSAPGISSKWILKSLSTQDDCLRIEINTSTKYINVYLQNNLWDSSIECHVIHADGFNYIGHGLTAGSWVTAPALSTNVINPSNAVYYGNLTGNATNADTLDGYHANGLFTDFSNYHSGTNHQLSIAIGGITKRTTPEFLAPYSGLTYGNSGLQYFNLNGTAGTTANSNVTPTSAWYHILRMNHSNSGGYFADIAVPLNDVAGMYWRQVRNGTNYGWYKLLDTNNVSPSIGISGNTIRVTVGGVNSSYITVPYATNADTVDGWHQTNLVWSGYVTSGTASLSSYWFKAWTGTITSYRYNDLDLTFLVASGFNDKRGLIHLKIRQNGENSGGAYNFSKSLTLCYGNIPLDHIRLYCNNSTGVCELWMNVVGQYGVYNYTVIKKTWRTGIDITSFGTLTASNFTTAQTVPALSTECIQMSGSAQTGMFWANLAVQTAASNTTVPSFGAIRMNGATSAGTNYITGTAGRIYFGGNFHIDSLGSNATYINHYTANNVYMVAGSSQGNVGIGTSSPSQKLHVAGNTRITGTLDICSEARLKIWNVTSTRNSSYGAEMVFLQTSIDSADPASSWPDKNRNDLFIQPYGGHVTIGERTTHHSYAFFVQGTSYFNGNVTHAGHIYNATNNTYDIGATGTRWRYGYFADRIFIGGTGFSAWDSNAAGTCVGTGWISVSNTTGTEGYYLLGQSTQYAKLYIETFGTTSTGGVTTFLLGNNKALGTANNARGRIRLYGAATYYTDILAQAPSSQIIYLPNYGGTMYLAHCSSNSSVGSSSKPVYVAANGRMTSCTYYLYATVNSGTANRMAYYSGANAISSTNFMIRAVQINESTSWSTNFETEVFGVADSNYYKFSIIRMQATAPDAVCDNYSTGIAWKGIDTFGIISITYPSTSPAIKFAGGNSSSDYNPKWWIKITGTANTTYDLNYLEALKGGGSSLSDINVNTLNRNKIYCHTSSATGRPSDNYGNMFQISNVDAPVAGTNQHWISQIDFTHDGRVWVRQRINTANWTTWRKILFQSDVSVSGNTLTIGSTTFTPSTGSSINHTRTTNTTNKQYILGAGNNSQPSNGTLSQVYTSSSFYFTHTGAYHTSDARKKYDIRDILNEDVNKLFETENGFIRHFKWINTKQDAYGFIAQELLEYCPEAVDFNSDNEYYAVNYNVAFSKIIGAMFKKIKELENKLKENGIS